MLFEDYTYQQGDEALPQPGTTDSGFDWNDFLNNLIGGVTTVVRTTQGQPTPYTATTTQVAPAAAGGRNDLLLLVIAGVLIYALMR